MRTRTYGLDRDTIAYANRIKVGSGKVLDNNAIKQINKFVVGIKRMGLWNSMVCWPMRSIHNAGTGSTVYSLGGLGVYNGTMVNSPTWNSKGIFFDSVVQNKQVSFVLDAATWTAASLCASYSSTDSTPFTLLATLNGASAVNDGTAKLSLTQFQSNSQVGLRQIGLTGGDNGRYTRFTGTIPRPNHSFFWGGCSDLFDPVNNLHYVQQDNISRSVKEGTGILPYVSNGKINWFFNTYGNATSRADTGSFGAVFKLFPDVSTIQLFRTLYKQTLGQNLGLV